MADTKTTDLTALTAPADADVLMVVDVSDTTMAASGTNKKIRLDDAREYFSVVVNVKDHGAVGDGTTSDTTAIQAAIDAIPDASGGVLWFPPGDYISNGAALASLPNATTVLGHGATLRSTSGAHNLWTIPASSQHLTFDGIKLQCHATGGHIFAPAGQVIFLTVQNCRLQQLNPAKSIWSQPNFGYYFNKWQDCYLFHGGATSVPAMDFTAATTSVHNGNVFQQITTENEATAGTWFFDFATSSAVDYLYDNMFRDFIVEVANGGFCRMRSCSAFLFENINFYDLTTTAQNLFWVGAHATGGVASRQHIFRHVVRRGGTLGSGLNDIFLETAKATNIKFEHCNTGTGSGYTVDLNSNTGAIAWGCSGVTFTDPPTMFLNIGDGGIDPAELSATGTRNSTTFLRGDNTWAAPASASPALQIYLAQNFR